MDFSSYFFWNLSESIQKIPSGIFFVADYSGILLGTIHVVFLFIPQNFRIFLRIPPKILTGIQKMPTKCS